MQTSIMRSVSAVALTMVLAVGASAARLDPAVACGFAKMHAALKASSSLNACFQHAITMGSDPDPTCVDAAHAVMVGDSDEADGGASAVGCGFILVDPLPTSQRTDGLARALTEYGVTL